MNTDINLIAYCSLYCGECRQYKKGKCPGCLKNEKAGWCKIRSCCMENNYRSCTDCEKEKPENCNYFNNFMAKLIALFFRSDRAKGIQYIKEYGYEKFAEEMSKNHKMCFKKNESY